MAAKVRLRYAPLDMRWKPLLAAVIVVALLLAAAPLPKTHASARVDDRSVIAQVSPQDAVADDDDRVEVQLVVLGVVLVTVFGLGTAAYLLRRKLGHTAYTPPADSGHH